MQNKERNINIKAPIPENLNTPTFSNYSRRQFIQKSAIIAGLAAIPKMSGAQNLITTMNTERRTKDHSHTSQNKMGIGCMGMSEFYGSINQNAIQRTLETAFDCGATLFDTADMYGNGTNEELIGRFAQSRRDKITIATKFGIVREGEKARFDNSPAYIRQACEASLKRLNTDYIDIYYVHRVNPLQPIEETISTMVDLLNEGKIKAIGLSEAAPATIRRAHAVYPLSTLQTEYSLFSREPESEIIPLCKELDITFVAYAPLCRGLLTGKSQDANKLETSDFRRGLPRFQSSNFEQNSTLVNRLIEVASQYGYSAAQLALAWILLKNPQITPIPGMRSVSHLADNLAAESIKLSTSEIEEITKLFPLNVSSGKRYSDEEMKTVGT